MEADIDRAAPVVTHDEITIQAPIATVWDMLTDIDAWPEWNRDVRSARLHGPLEAGTEFTWKAGPGTIRSTLVAVDPPHGIAWHGRTMGITARHVYRLEDLEGGVRVTTEESWQGFLPKLLGRSMQRTLDESIRRGLESARDAAEARA